MDKALLREFVRMSQSVGSRPDYVQGGGGNTSVKMDGLMAIKASGFRLDQVTETDAYATVETATLRDVTVEHGLPPLRPSVETGFHALLGRFVLHSHPVYANLALCSEKGSERLADLMTGYGWIAVPYINPGAALSAAIGERLQADTQVVFMQNHGLIVTADTADECLRIHDDVNMRIADSYGVTAADFGRFAAIAAAPLYPDQQVYLELTEAQAQIMAAVMFIHFTLLRQGEEARAMDGAAMDYIAHWESEAYRKTIVQ